MLDLSKVGEEDRSRILEYVVEKYGRGVIQESLGVSRYIMWRLLNRKVRIDDSKLRVLLGLITFQGFQDVMSFSKVLGVLGVVREDGSMLGL